MNCSFCHGHSRPAKRMSQEEFCTILGKLQGQTGYIYYHLMGEPLTHPDLCQFITTATTQGFRSVITTNGTLLKDKSAPLIAAKPHKVNISLHSFEGDDEATFKNYVLNLADFAKSACEQGVIVVFRLWNKGFDGGKNENSVAVLTSEVAKLCFFKTGL